MAAKAYIRTKLNNVKVSQDLPFLWKRTVRFGVLSSSIDRPHVHWRRCRLLNRLVGILAERGCTLTTLATAARVDAATRHGEHKDKTPDEDVRPVACHCAHDVLFPLAGRNGGVRLLRGWEERLGCRARRIYTVHASLDEVGLRGRRVGHGQ